MEWQSCSTLEHAAFVLITFLALLALQAYRDTALGHLQSICGGLEAFYMALSIDERQKKLHFVGAFCNCLRAFDVESEH